MRRATYFFCVAEQKIKAGGEILAEIGISLGFFSAVVKAPGCILIMEITG